MTQALSPTAPTPIATHSAMLWTGRILTAIVGALVLMGATMSILRVPQAVEGTVQLGYPESVMLPLGVFQLVALALYLYPRTSTFGAILWTAYLGGAVATHVRLGQPFLSPILFAVILWIALWLRDGRLRALVPFRRPE